jgi:hypothetical protein
VRRKPRAKVLRRKLAALVAFWMAIALVCATEAAVAAPELSVSQRLQDRRYDVAGERARAIGFEDGRFYANGWHITGEMGGVWSEPLKLVDGVWFGIGDQWVGPATKFASGWGYAKFDLPSAGGLNLERTDFVPDGRRAALFGLKMTNPSAGNVTVTVKVDAHSELMTEYPWGFGGVTPNASDNLPDTAAVDNGALVFRDQGQLPDPDAPLHDYAALVASNRTPIGSEVGDGYRGPQGANVCTGNETPSQCDDGPFGNGKGGQLRYGITVPGGGSRTLWMAVAGSDKGMGEAQDELTAALQDPAGELAQKIARRVQWGNRTQLFLPGDQRLAHAVDWGKQNLLDLTRTAQDLKIRWTDQGKQFPPPAGSVAQARWVGAGFPDYPWMFATDGEYTAFASVAVGQFEAIKDHLRALAQVSNILNPDTGVVAHEVVSDGSIWFGKDTSHIDPATGERRYDFNTDETVKFPSAVALVWRWTGDNGFRDDLYAFSGRALHYAVEHLDEDGDGWPEGSGNVERSGMGVEKLDNAVYLIRGLYDFADMAKSRGDADAFQWATEHAEQLLESFEGTWWMGAEVRQHADSIDDPPAGGANNQQQDKHWIGVTPMEAELAIGDRAVPGLTTLDHGDQALALRETDCFSGTRPYNLGLFHTGCGGGSGGQGERVIFGLNTAIQAVGEGNYGRLGAGQQQRYTGAEAEPMFAEPWTGGTPDEQPGALPEILPSPDFGGGDDDANIDRCWTCRAMFVQAWGHYGTAWPVVHQQLGVRPDLGRRELEVVPQLPPRRTSISGSNIRLGDGSIDVTAERLRSRYTTKVDPHVALAELVIGHTLPHNASVQGVTLDGSPVAFAERPTNRGLEVLVKAPVAGAHQLVVHAG